MARNKRPKYKIPSSVLAATKLAQLRSEGDMPGYDQASGNINLMAANALAGARETGRAGEQLQSIVGQSNRAYRDLASQNMQYQDQADRQYEQSLQQLGQFQDQEWQMNEFAPYADRQQLYEDMFGAGAQNLFEGLSMMPKRPIPDMPGMAPLTRLPGKEFGVSSQYQRPLRTRFGSVSSIGSPTFGAIGSPPTLPNSSIRPVYDAARLSLLGL
jgi:hypothetical protein